MANRTLPFALLLALLLAAPMVTPAGDKPLTSRPNSLGGRTWSNGVRARPNSLHGETYFIPGGRRVECRPNSRGGQTRH